MDCTTLLVVSGLERTAQAACGMAWALTFLSGVSLCVVTEAFTRPLPDAWRAAVVVFEVAFAVAVVAGVTAAALPNLYELQELYGKGCIP